MIMADLSTNYLGFDLKHPIVPSASPLSSTVDGVRKLEDAGAPMITLASLFAEQVGLSDAALEHGAVDADAFPDWLDYYPDLGASAPEPEAYLELISESRRAVGVPIVASLNGSTRGPWLEYARHIEQAGANALELNLYAIPTDPMISASAVETRYLEIVREVSETVAIPVAVKLMPFLTAPANIAMRLAEAGANALVMFNRFYQPDLDPEEPELKPNLTLSTPFDSRLPLRWASILYGRVPLELAVTGGVRSHLEVVKAVMCGAKVAMVASELLEYGVGRLQKLTDDLSDWLEAHGHHSLRPLEGIVSETRLANPDAFERAAYIKVLGSWHARGKRPVEWSPYTRPT
jgi:dihydroorotate dehydrogenase (fumarate)